MNVIPPEAELELEAWAGPFAEGLAASPEAYGLLPGDAADLAALLADFEAKLAVANDPATRTRGAVEAKNVALRALRRKAMELVRRISATPSVTDAMRLSIGLRPLRRERSPVAAPDGAPALSLDPRGVLRLRDGLGTGRRARPANARGALVRYAILAPGEAPPAAPDDARHALLATRGRVAIPLPPGSDGQKLHALAQWYNERGELGPVSAVASTTIAA